MSFLKKLDLSIDRAAAVAKAASAAAKTEAKVQGITLAKPNVKAGAKALANNTIRFSAKTLRGLQAAGKEFKNELKK